MERYYVADTNDIADEDGSAQLVEGAVTYRVFLDMKEGYDLQILGGFANHALTFNTTTSFFNNEDRGEAWGDAINDIHLGKNTVAIDSWLAIGASSDAHWGVLKADDPDGSIVGGVNNDGGSNSVAGGLLSNDVASIGIPLTVADGLMTSSPVPPASTYVGTPPEIFNTGGEAYSDENFGLAVLGDVHCPTPGNKLLIGQFTTDGIFSFCLNFWLKIPDSLVCADANCHTKVEYYGQLLESDTAGSGFGGDNKFTLPSLCFNSSELALDCEGVPGGAALVGTACNDGDPDTGNDLWQEGCVCAGSVGLQDLDRAVVSIFPNPTHDRVRMDLEHLSGKNVIIELKNAMGEVVLEQARGARFGKWTESLDLSGSAAGTYFLKISVGDQVHTERIVKF